MGSDNGAYRISDSAGLLVSILLRYPEVGTIDYDPSADRLKLTFIVAENLSEQAALEVRGLILNSLEAYHFLVGSPSRVSQVSIKPMETLSTLEVERDLATLSTGELALVIELLHQAFPHILVSDGTAEVMEEEQLLEEEFIGHMLEQAKGEPVAARRLMAIRDEGRVLVFNR